MIAQTFSELSTTHLFFKFEPEILDFTKNDIPELQFYIAEKEIKVPLTDLPFLLSILKLTVFKKDIKIITWNWKNFISYILNKTGKEYSVEGNILDLKIIESYAGIKNKPPNSFSEALTRIKQVLPLYEKNIYNKIHLPLITTVIPYLENSGILDDKKKLFAHYEIDGQENGRFKCSNIFGFNPHVLSPNIKKVLKPRFENELFMIFDFKGMEVKVLAWMSKDKNLLELCRKDDVYEELSDKLFGKKDRNLAKKTFLPTIYGQSAFTLSKKCEIPLEDAEIILNKIKELFPDAINFVESYQKIGFVKDIFGKRRYFEEGYLARNFSVQSPSALLCSEKLIKLYFGIKTDIAFTVHDGFCIYTTKDNWKAHYKTAKEILTSESELFQGLKLNVSCFAGRSLDNLKSLNRKDI